MADNGFVPADKVTVEETSALKSHFIETDGGIHYTEPIPSSQELNRVKNSYAKQDDLYKKIDIKYKNEHGPLFDTRTTTYKTKVPTGASYYNFNTDKQQKQQEKKQNIVQKSLDLFKSIIPIFF
jgi:hypothetical protein